MIESLEEGAPAIDLKRLAALEKKLGVVFPDTYRQFLLAHNGGRPSPADFVAPIDGVPTWMRVHFFFGIDDSIESCDLVWNYEAFRARLPAAVIPIAGDEFGNTFCLDLRKGQVGAILFFDHEQEHRGTSRSLKLIAKSFSEWISLFMWQA